MTLERRAVPGAARPLPPGSAARSLAPRGAVPSPVPTSYAQSYVSFAPPVFADSLDKAGAAPRQPPTVPASARAAALGGRSAAEVLSAVGSARASKMAPTGGASMSPAAGAGSFRQAPGSAGSFREEIGGCAAPPFEPFCCTALAATRAAPARRRRCCVRPPGARVTAARGGAGSG